MVFPFPVVLVKGALSPASSALQVPIVRKFSLCAEPRPAPAPRGRPPGRLASAHASAADRARARRGAHRAPALNTKS